MLTRRGWATTGTSATLLVTGRVLGLVELTIVAVAAVALVIGAVTYALLTRFQLAASRELHPPRVHAGTESRVDLTVRNVGPRRSPVLTVRDPFDQGRRAARFLIAPLAPGERARAAYRLPTEARGVFDLGPLELRLTDPFGLAATSLPAAPATKLTVFPRVDDVDPVPHTLGHDPHAGSDRMSMLSHLGEEFFALRPYEVGDDLRRVHWLSTAKTGELMIRQEELPWQGRTTVLLDLRPAVHTEASLELAVSAAASLVMASWRHRSLLRMVGTDGVDSGFAAGHSHVEAILEHLAEVRARRGAELRAVVTSLRRHGTGGALVVITTAAASDGDLSAMARLQARYGNVVVVLFDRPDRPASAGAETTPGRSRPLPGLGRVVRVTAQRPFAHAWREMLQAVPERSVWR